MKPQETKALVDDITPLTNSILKIILSPEQYIDYHAGQYLQILFGEEAFSYSIANAPLGSHKYELHIRHSPDNPYNQPLLAAIKRDGSVRLRLPLGICNLERLDVEKPILFIAIGTGFSPIKAMIEQLLAAGSKQRFELFWGARSQSDLYMDEKVLHWQTHVDNFRYFAQVTENSKNNLLNKVLQQHEASLSDWQIVMSGPFDMIYNIRDTLLAKGASSELLFSDAFSFEEKK